MRRTLLCASLFALTLGGIGCRSNYVAGRCDCTHNPADAIVAPPSNPYPVIGGSTGTTTTAPEKMPAK